MRQIAAARLFSLRVHDNCDAHAVFVAQPPAAMKTALCTFKIPGAPRRVDPRAESAAVRVARCYRRSPTETRSLRMTSGQFRPRIIEFWTSLSAVGTKSLV